MGTRNEPDGWAEWTYWIGSADIGIGEALAHVLAAVRAREMHTVALGGGNKIADLLEPTRRKPSLAPPALHGEAVGGLLVGAAELVAALVGKNPELHRGRNLGHQARIEDQESRIGGAVIVELTVDHHPALSAHLRLAVELQPPGGQHLRIAADMGGILFGRRNVVRSRLAQV